jgi:hypothetical protein
VLNDTGILKAEGIKLLMGILKIHLKQQKEGINTMKESKPQNSSLMIAPCGINCETCVGFFGYTMSGKKRKHTCIGCRLVSKKCAFLMKDCDKLANDEVEFCFECEDFPCQNLKALDERYRKAYDMSLIDNLNRVRDLGVEKYLVEEREKWKCSSCGKMICVHTSRCYNCNPP